MSAGAPPALSVSPGQRPEIEQDAILRIEHATKRFGGLVAVDDVSFDVERNQVFALIGPNGAGKTTLFNSITGIFPPTSGRVIFEGNDIAGELGRAGGHTPSLQHEGDERAS